jgi:hypothetical protein
LLCCQRLGQRRLVVDTAASGGDEIGVRLHLRELRRAHHATGFRRVRAVDRDVVGLAQQVLYSRPQVS